MVKAQEVSDLRARRDDLERRVHDLKLTRQVMMQSLPSIGIVQQNDKALVLWRQQLAMALTIARSAEAGATLKKAAGFDCASRLTPGAPTKASRAEHYAASFRVAGPGKDTSVALLWAKEDGYWKIVSWYVAPKPDETPVPPAPPEPNTLWCLVAGRVSTDGANDNSGVVTKIREPIVRNLSDEYAQSVREPTILREGTCLMCVRLSGEGRPVVGRSSDEHHSR